MDQFTKSQIGRIAIRTFKTTADALALRGYYRPEGKSGKTLQESLKLLSPEIYGSMNDPRIIELKGLEYVMTRLPLGVEECCRLTLTAEEELNETSFKKIIPRKRRRVSYRVSRDEMNFIITRGMSEIYDILTHLTFLNIESQKIRKQVKDENGEISHEWKMLQQHALAENISDGDLDQALWNLSIIVGRTFHETKEAWLELEKDEEGVRTNNNLFRIIYNLGLRAIIEEENPDKRHMIYFTPSLRELIGRHNYGRIWADTLKNKIDQLGYIDREIHLVSANMHSFMNLLYAYEAINEGDTDIDLYEFINEVKTQFNEIRAYAEPRGLHYIDDKSGSYIDCQIIDTSYIPSLKLHPMLHFNVDSIVKAPVIIVMDYAFGEQAYEVMDELLTPFHCNGSEKQLNFKSISVMGKAGILPGKKGDIMLASAHVFEGTPHNYIVHNDLSISDFDDTVNIYEGPIVTVLGTSLQNKDVMERFHNTSWKAIGLEMEGGHYHRAINAAIIRKHLPPDIKVRYAYYASDNPIMSGQTLASGQLGDDGIKPTYMISKIILEKILN